MSKKSETIRIGLLTALIAFAMVSAFAIIMSPNGGITGKAYAYRQDFTLGGVSGGSGGTGTTPCDCPGY
jgi:hypothetical protein